MAGTDESPERRAAELTRRVQGILRETEREFGSMPFFVRPMVRRGFAKRTGRDFDEWQKELARAQTVLEGGGGGKGALGGLVSELAGLAEHYRTAPERAARGMGGNPDALARVTELSKEREGVVRELLRVLDALR